MQSEAVSMVPHFGQANFNKQTKSKPMPFFLRQIADSAYILVMFLNLILRRASIMTS